MDDLTRWRPLRRPARDLGRQTGAPGAPARRVGAPDQRVSALGAFRGVVFRTRLAMLAERLARVLWAPAALLGGIWALAAFGVADVLDRGALLVVTAGVILGAVVLALLNARRFRWPRREEALARIDAALPGRPIAALMDVQALGRDDPGAAAVWAMHRVRMGRLARGARAAWPAPGLAGRDPWALRLAAATMVLAALVFAPKDGFGPISAALKPPAATAVASGPSYEAWARPPDYTGRPALYLPEVPGERAVELPEGTEITIRAYGDTDGFSLSESVSGSGRSGFTAAAAGIAVAGFPVERSGSVAIREGDTTLGAWAFVMIPDEPPTIALAEPVARATGGAARIAWAASDDYGVTGAGAEIRLDLARTDRRHGLAPEPAPRAPLSVELPMPMRGAGAEVEDALVEDFSKHPWAGLPIRLTLSAEDARGQRGATEAIEAVLPGRRFFDPLAAALVEQRRDLLWTAENARRVTQVLRAVTHRPEDIFPDGRAYLLVRTAIRRLARAQEEDAAGEENAVGAVIEEAAETLWQAALLLEEGGVGDAAERLARAQERLREALEGNASDEEIAELMEELRDATREYMQRLAEEAIERGATDQAENRNGQAMTPDQIGELMDRIQELSEQGRRAEAEALLEMLGQMLANMEMRLAEGGSGGQGTMEDLAETLRDQQGLADESFQELQREFRRNRMGQGTRGESDGEGNSPEALARRQEEIREALDALRDGMPAARGEAGEQARAALREAERNMDEARDRLESGDMAGALDRQSDAIEQLREGMRGIGEEMRQAEGGEEGSGEDGQAFSEGRADPLGRPLGGNGRLDGGGWTLPDGTARARARELLDEIRRRAGDLSRPEVELDYLRRLLDRF